MKKLSKLMKVLFAVSIILSVISCSNDSSIKNMIPKTASVVVVFDGKQIAQKGGIEDFTKTKSFEKAVSMMSPEELKTLKKFEKIIKNPQESGLNLQSEIFMFVNANEKIGKQAAFLMSVLDKSKFEKFIVSLSEEGAEKLEIQSGEGLSYIQEKQKPSEIVVWNENTIMMLVSNDEQSIDIKKAKQYFSQKESESIVDNKQFDEFYKNKKDISCFVDMKAVIGMSSPEATAMMSQLPYNFDGSSIELHISFEMGKVVAEMIQHQGKDMEKMMKDYALIKEKYNVDLLKILPEKSYANMFFAINLGEYYRFIKALSKTNSGMSLDSYEKNAEALLGMKIEDFLKTFDGEFSINLHDLQVIESKNPALAWDKSAEPTIKEIYPKFSILAKMNSSQGFDNIMKLYGSYLTKKKNYYSTVALDDMEMFIGQINGILIFTNDEMIMANATAGSTGGKCLKDNPLTSNLNNFSIYGSMIFDADKYPVEVMDYLKNNKDESSFSFLVNMAKYYQSIEFKPLSATHSRVELILKDNSKNSLNIILNSFDENIDLISEI